MHKIIVGGKIIVILLKIPKNFFPFDKEDKSLNENVFLNIFSFNVL